VHQELTTESVCYLRSEFRHVPWIPILQGWLVPEYVNHVSLYQKAGIDLTWEPVGSQVGWPRDLGGFSMILAGNWRIRHDH
jgi:hypothetical protein